MVNKHVSVDAVKTTISYRFTMFLLHPYTSESIGTDKVLVQPYSPELFQHSTEICSITKTPLFMLYYNSCAFFLISLLATIILNYVLYSL